MVKAEKSWFMYHIILNFISFQGVAALRCFECNDIFKPYLCDIITTCTTGEECFIEQYVTSSGNVLYKSGCRSTQRCSATKRELGNLGLGDDAAGDVVYDVASDLLTCSQCCNGTDYCNKDGCNQYGTERSKRGPYCFDCRKQGKGSCRHVTQCDLHYACEITTEESNGITLYNSQCVHAPTSQTCNISNLRLAPSIVGKRALNSSDNCPKCCNEDFCNEDCTQNPVNGGFSSWSSWSNCDVTCGNNGTQMRSRLCNNPAPSNGGLDCQGAVTALRPCSNLPVCQSSDGFTAWTAWSHCSVTCGSIGIQYREKICIGGTAQSQTVQCSKPVREAQTCHGDQECLAVDGGWDTWHSWSRCLSKCGQGYQHRYRYCSNPRLQHGGKQCPGDHEQRILCDNTGKCDDTGYSEWTPWSACSRSCGIHAIKTRTRTCQTGFPGRGNCEGSIDERIPCHLHFPCPKVNGGWSSWFHWSHCSASCGLGQQLRKRFCNKPSPKDGGDECRGDDSETKGCLGFECLVI